MVVLAQHEARTLDHDSIGTEHILLALIREGGAGAQLLAGAGVDLDRARRQVIVLLTNTAKRARPPLPRPRPPTSSWAG